MTVRGEELTYESIEDRWNFAANNEGLKFWIDFSKGNIISLRAIGSQATVLKAWSINCSTSAIRLS